MLYLSACRVHVLLRRNKNYCYDLRKGLSKCCKIKSNVCFSGPGSGSSEQRLAVSRCSGRYKDIGGRSGNPVCESEELRQLSGSVRVVLQFEQREESLYGVSSNHSNGAGQSYCRCCVLSQQFKNCWSKLLFFQVLVKLLESRIDCKSQQHSS